MPLNEFIPLRYRDGARRMALALQHMDRVLIAAHAHPDGDALGSVAAAGYLLRCLGKNFFLYVTPRVPHDLSFMPLPGIQLSALDRLPFTHRSALLLDCGEPHRLGQDLAKCLPQWVTVNIDHHPGGNGMGSMDNWIEPEAAATAQLIAYVALEAGIPLEGELATAIALGLVTDTGGFRHGNTTPDMLRLTALLVENGCHLAALRDQLDNNWTLERMRLWGLLMSRVTVRRQNTIAFCSVSLKDLTVSKATKEDLEGFVEHMRKLRDVRAAALLREDAPGCCKFSLRSSGSVDVRQAAATLGGGGHRNAAGGTLHMSMHEAEESLTTALSQALESGGY
ncbi:MAG: bifunctional oligoribonuclease/PAP phosphatase NrnA [Desulfovibrio sp.]|nr:bifunctional oligoribonuclease/PAP phosphatase NrnA [Desulfovibrio sp.]